MVKTPELGDKSRSDVETLVDVAKWLSDAYSNRLLLCGIVYLHRVGDLRMHGSFKRSLDLFQKLCGTENFANVSTLR